MKRRILILYTGGTIGMAPSECGYVPMTGFRQLLHSHSRKGATKQLPEFELIEFEELIDSANLQPSDWTRMGELIERHWSDYDGFVVLHGTDTLAYTASALSFMFQGADKPIIITGSQIPLTELRNDALDNLLTVIIMEGNYDIPGVCVYFNGSLLRGNRCIKLKSNSFDAFASPNFPQLGQVGINIDLNHHLLQNSRTLVINVPEFNSNEVVVVQIYPGMSARILAAMLDSTEIKGLILQTYGLGNAPNANGEFITILQQAVDRGIAILNVTQCCYGSVDQKTYATGDALSQLGVIPGSDLTLEAAFAKMHFLLACGLSGAALRRELSRPICGECE
jgi:L-asparaginase